MIQRIVNKAIMPRATPKKYRSFLFIRAGRDVVDRRVASKAESSKAHMGVSRNRVPGAPLASSINAVSFGLDRGNKGRGILYKESTDSIHYVDST